MYCGFSGRRYAADYYIGLQSSMNRIPLRGNSWVITDYYLPPVKIEL